MNNETKVLGGIILLTVILFGIGIMFTGKTETVKTDLLTELESVTGTNIKGNPDGADIVIEFADFQCPSCAVFAPVLNQFVDEHKDNIKFIMKYFPLVSIHKNAMNSAYAAQASANQGRFWEMHDLLYSKQAEWSELDNVEEQFIAYAKELGLDPDKFKDDYLSKEVRDIIRDDMSLSLRLGLDSTPTLFINGKKYVGPPTIADFNSALEKSR